MRSVRLVTGLACACLVAGCNSNYRWFVGFTIAADAAASAGQISALKVCAGAGDLRASATVANQYEFWSKEKEPVDKFATCARRIAGVKIYEIMRTNVDPRNRLD